MHGDLCKHLGTDSGTDHPDRYSNLFLNAYISIKRHIWKYKDGVYENLKHKFGNTDWTSFVNEDICIYSQNVKDHILQLSSVCIPNKIASSRPSETPWMHNDLRKVLRKRKRAYDKAKRAQLQQHWDQYKRLQNDTTKLLRSSKKTYFDNLANKLLPAIT